ncbi:hypothetical protein ACWD3I_40490 [Streptomyces sp. NPDC002817]|uniref:hypothetical protein n=1 Tax=Streptomyces sp. NPDC088357 TaxID=3154655 RepID=UPI00343C61A1
MGCDADTAGTDARHALAFPAHLVAFDLLRLNTGPHRPPLQRTIRRAADVVPQARPGGALNDPKQARVWLADDTAVGIASLVFMPQDFGVRVPGERLGRSPGEVVGRPAGGIQLGDQRAGLEPHDLLDERRLVQVVAGESGAQPFHPDLDVPLPSGSAQGGP